MMSDTMHRTQLLLDDWQYDALKAQARGSRRSLSDLVRQIVSEHLAAGAERAGNRWDAVEGVAEGPPDLGAGHDGYLYGSAASPRATGASIHSAEGARPPGKRPARRK